MLYSHPATAHYFALIYHISTPDPPINKNLQPANAHISTQQQQHPKNLHPTHITTQKKRQLQELPLRMFSQRIAIP